jgi:hypothetical protein
MVATSMASSVLSGNPQEHPILPDFTVSCRDYGSARARLLRTEPARSGLSLGVARVRDAYVSPAGSVIRQAQYPRTALRRRHPRWCEHMSPQGAAYNAANKASRIATTVAIPIRVRIVKIQVSGSICFSRCVDADMIIASMAYRTRPRPRPRPTPPQARCDVSGGQGGNVRVLPEDLFLR